MKNRKDLYMASIIFAACFVFMVFAVPAGAQVISKNLGVAVYPTRGQSKDMQAKDESGCYNWAKQETGIDPSSPPKAAQQPSGPDGSRVRGAARGAARGAVVGEIANDDASKGGAVGAVAGAVRGKQHSRKAKSEQQKQAAAGQTEAFRKAFSACMEGKGYSAK